MTVNDGILLLNGGLQLRGGRAEVLSEVNPVLLEREIMIETDTGKLKVGDGTSRWNELEYYGGQSGEASTETIHKVILTEDNIAQKYIELPEDCDTTKFTALYIQGLITEPGVDWAIVEKTAPEKDRISWAGLGLESTAQSGDKVLVSYYKKA